MRPAVPVAVPLWIRTAASISLHSRGSLLALCDMKTLYLRNVPDDVSERLASLAAREGLSVSSFALRELTDAARRADNPALLGELPDLDVSAKDVVIDLEVGRSAR
jgi:plasmid stability protein